MLVEAYFTALYTCLVYGRVECWLVISFITALIAFVFSAGITYYAIKRDYKFNWFSRFLATEGLLFAAWTLELLSSGVNLGKYFFLPLLSSIGLFIVFVLPASIAYSKTLDRYPQLPWHFTQFFYCFLASLVFWALLMFWFQLFTVDPFVFLD